MYRFVLSTLLAVCAFSVTAADEPTTVVTQALHKLTPNAKIESVTPAPLTGFYSVVADGHPVFVSTDGKYLIGGHV